MGQILIKSRYLSPVSVSGYMSRHVELHDLGRHHCVWEAHV